VIPFGVTDVPLRPVYHMAALLGVEVPKWDIADEFGETDLLVRTIEQGRSLARALGDRPAVLMRGHGSAVVSGRVRDVVISAVYLEQNARLQMQALALGGGKVKYVSAREAELMSDMLLKGIANDRAWNAWAARVGRGTAL
jgi:HCOMODA/2-hydroxy-3-carboxy-muconic semialdehyde decarboxylase